MAYLDNEREEQLGKFEGETRATRYLYELGLEQRADEEFSHESFGWFALFVKMNAADMVELISPAYIMQEHDNGFVTSRAYDTEAEARNAWDTLVAELEQVA